MHCYSCIIMCIFVNLDSWVNLFAQKSCVFAAVKFGSFLTVGQQCLCCMGIKALCTFQFYRNLAFHFLNVMCLSCKIKTIYEVSIQQNLKTAQNLEFLCGFSFDVKGSHKVRRKIWYIVLNLTQFYVFRLRCQRVDRGIDWSRFWKAYKWAFQQLREKTSFL